MLQDFGDRFQDFERIPKIRLVAFPHLMETETALLDFQMELVELNNNEQLVKKSKKKIYRTRGKMQLNIQCYKNGPKTFSFLNTLTCAKQCFHE